MEPAPPTTITALGRSLTAASSHPVSRRSRQIRRSVVASDRVLRNRYRPRMGRRRGFAGGGHARTGVIGRSRPSGSLDAGPIFLDVDGVARQSFMEAVGSVDGPVEVDATAVASMLSFQYVVDGRSLVAQVKRRPWLATVAGSEDQSDTTALARHGRRVTTTHAAAKDLLHHMRRELEHAFGAAQRITLLLSGGLDSRLASAVLVDLARQGKVTDEVRAVTWGIPESRDRHYGARVARCLGVSWIPIDLGPADLARNIEIAARGARRLGVAGPPPCGACSRRARLGPR